MTINWQFHYFEKCVLLFHSAISDYGNPRSEGKFIVVLSQLLLLFTICPGLKSAKPVIETGTMVKVTTKCFYPHCAKSKILEKVSHKWMEQKWQLEFSPLFLYIGIWCFLFQNSAGFWKYGTGMLHLEDL